jgi:RNA polymerase sigma-70 factor (ECF subfamily)
MTLSSGQPGSVIADDGAPADTQRRLHDLYREHSPRLVRQLRRETGCHDVALDLAQEAFVRLLGIAPAKVLRIERVEAYLQRISVNLLRDWGRGRALAERSRPTMEIVTDDRVDQLAILESRDTLRRLEQAMHKLRPKTREIFLAHRVHGLSYSEIAELTGLSVKGVEKQMGKAIAKIDRLLDRT